MNSDEELRQRVVHLERKVAFLLREMGLEEKEKNTAPPDDELRDLIERGNMIAAIALYRERFGVGLREAKEAVDAMAGERE